MSLIRLELHYDELEPADDGQYISYDDYIAEKKSMVEAAENNLKALQAITDLIDGGYQSRDEIEGEIEAVLIELQPLLAASFIAEHFKGNGNG